MNPALEISKAPQKRRQKLLVATHAASALDDGLTSDGARDRWAAAPTGSEPVGIVDRPELVARLERGLERGVVVISAPAGSGKTVLVRSWMRATRRSAAWVSVERGEPDAQRFWASVVDAIRVDLPRHDPKDG